MISNPYLFFFFAIRNQFGRRCWSRWATRIQWLDRLSEKGYKIGWTYRSVSWLYGFRAGHYYLSCRLFWILWHLSWFFAKSKANAVLCQLGHCPGCDNHSWHRIIPLRHCATPYDDAVGSKKIWNALQKYCPLLGYDCQTRGCRRLLQGRLLQHYSRYWRSACTRHLWWDEEICMNTLERFWWLI